VEQGDTQSAHIFLLSKYPELQTHPGASDLFVGSKQSKHAPALLQLPQG
jgi:hypothetical protein